MLSAKELFKYRIGHEQSLPTKGGEKEFMPDGSWLQHKHIENFHQDIERVISEPRVVRRYDIVRGEWNPDKGLVELSEMKHFWEHMGFTDSKRKWLYPEEAVFLVETNILEILYHGLPLSVQEAYTQLLGENITLDYYQVYSHLRRIGYVVLRHQGRYGYTKYERKIGLDKHSSPKKKRNKGKAGNQSSDLSKDGYKDPSNERTKKEKSDKVLNTISDDSGSCGLNFDSGGKVGDGAQSKKQKLDYQSAAESNMGRTGKQQAEKSAFKEENRCDRISGSDGECLQNQNLENMDTLSQGTSNKLEGNRDMTNAFESNKGVEMKYEIKEKGSEWYLSESKVSINKGNQKSNIQTNCELEDKGIQRNHIKLSEWNFNEIVFPNFKTSQETVFVIKPKVAYIPQGDDTQFTNEEYSFIKKEYINTKKQKLKQQLLDEEKVRQLDFSYPEIMTGWHKVKKSCTNWREYKAAVEKEKASWDRSAVFPHLYSDKVKPLVKPELARSTCAVLEQLMIIEEDVPSPVLNKPEILPDFDVYAPNTKFKKSQPGVPDFRVKVTRTSDPVPSLQIVDSINRYLNDEAPLHWAVVDCGHIAFYCMSDMMLSQDIALG